MTTYKITDLPQLSETPATTDVLTIVDTSEDTTKKILVSDLVSIVETGIDSSDAHVIAVAAADQRINLHVPSMIDSDYVQARAATSQDSASIASIVQSEFFDTNNINWGGGAGSVAQQSNGNQIALGFYAGNTSQDFDCIAIGTMAGRKDQGNRAIAIGKEAGSGDPYSSFQNTNAVAIGYRAGYHTQNNNAIALGATSGQWDQSSEAVAVGYGAGQTNQGQYSVCLGYYAGKTNAGKSSILINSAHSGAGVGYLERTDDYAIEIRSTDSDGRMWFSKDSDWNFGAPVTASSFNGNGSGLSNLNMGGTMTGHIIPDTNAAYDLGSAEYKIRHLFLSDNSLHTDGGSLSFNDGRVSYAGDPVVMLSELKQIAASSETFADFKAAIAAM